MVNTFLCFTVVEQNWHHNFDVAIDKVDAKIQITLLGFPKFFWLSILLQICLCGLDKGINKGWKWQGLPFIRLWSTLIHPSFASYTPLIEVGADMGELGAHLVVSPFGFGRFNDMAIHVGTWIDLASKMFVHRKNYSSFWSNCLNCFGEH